MPGLINLDFADVRTVMQDGGNALMGIGFATGENRAREAAERALRSPLIDTEIAGARGILLSIAGGDDLSLFEVNEAAEVVRQGAVDDTNLIFGATIDERLTGQVWVTVIATGLGGERRPRRPLAVHPRDVAPRTTRSSRRASCADEFAYRLPPVAVTASAGTARCFRARTGRCAAMSYARSGCSCEGRDRRRAPADRRGRRRGSSPRAGTRSTPASPPPSPPGWPRAR